MFLVCGPSLGQAPGAPGQDVRSGHQRDQAPGQHIVIPNISQLLYMFSGVKKNENEVYCNLVIHALIIPLLLS